MAKVYVSATYEDLVDCREAVAEAIRRLGLQDVAMESYVAEPRRPLDRCLADVRRCDIYLGIFAWRYGFIPSGHNASITELEFQAAAAAGKPCLIFLLDEEARWPRRYVDREPDASRVDALRRRLEGAYLCSKFVDSSDLAAKATAALAVHLANASPAVPVLDTQARRRYLDQLRSQLGNLDLDTLTPPQNDPGTLRVSLSSVFVEPSVRADPPPVELPREWWARLSDADPGRGPDGSEDVAAEPMAMLHDAYRAKPRQPVFDVLVEPERRLTVLLGNPGAGKSTVARYLALQLADSQADPRLAPLRECLPIVVEVRMYAAIRAEGKCANFLGYLGYRYEAGVFALHPQALDDHLAAGAPTVVIFDGLDEIFDGRRRQEVAEQIAAFSTQFSTVRVIVTSRILEYTSRAHGNVRRTLANAGFAHFTLQDLDLGQIRTFLTRWFIGVLGQDARDAAQRSAGLMRDITGSRPLRELAGNPMLLTILAIINRHQALPRDRWKLYHHAADVLVEHWEVSRDLVPGEVAQFDAEDKQELLRRLAFEMQTGNIGQSGGYIAREDLVQVFVEYLVERYEHDRATAHQTAGRMIDQLRERNFILSLYGSHMYGFVHRTFLEFFAAAAILDKFRHERAWSFERVKEVFGQHWPEASWREVLRLLAGELSEADNGELIDQLARTNGDWLVTENAPLPWNLALAVQCLSQVRRIGRVPAAEHLLRRLVILLEQCAPLLETDLEEALPGLRPPRDAITAAAVLIEDEILPAAAVIGPAWPGREAYLSWYVRRGRWIDDAVAGHAARLASFLARPADQLPTRQGEAIAAQGDVRIANAALQGLAEAADREQATGAAASAGRTALDELVTAATGDGRAVVRLTAVEALGRFAALRRVRDVLVDRTRNDPYAYVRLAAVQHLGAELDAEPSLLPVLLGCASDARHVVRAAVVRLLAALTEPGDRVEQALFDRCELDTQADVLLLAAPPLLARSPLAVALRGVLAHRAEHAPDAAIRAAAIKLLAREVDPVSQPDLFLRRITTDADATVVRAAAQAVLADRPAEVREILMSRLRADSDEAVRAALAAVVVEVLPVEEATADDLIGLVRVDPDPGVRVALLAAGSAVGLMRDPRQRGAVLALARDLQQVPAVRLAAVRALTPALAEQGEAEAFAAVATTDPDTGVRLAAVAALPNRQLTGDARRLLVDVVDDDRSARVRWAALNRILQDGLEPEHHPLLLRVLARDVDAEVFDLAAAAVLDLMKGMDDVSAAQAVFEVVALRTADANPELRAAALALLANRFAVVDRAYQVVCGRLREDPDPDVVTAVAAAAVRQFADRPDLPGLLLTRLSDPNADIRCAAARSLATWCQSNREVRLRLSAVAASGGDLRLRCVALAAVAVAAHLPDVRALLLQLLTDGERPVRTVAVHILGRRLGHDQAVRDSLTAALQREQPPDVRRVIEATLVWTGEAEVERFPDTGPGDLGDPVAPGRIS
ncbi:HEAT repeat domain-containing protein [Solwaraspora sp. WMMD792]|uniref:HEAT repeat domain-containing protein n=1 Tax=Solwaraspora sp. WMMD792 TaxID=3016099 RepID=UPI0024174516|nr:HEAT repeat domain-containing protein [Solwaraspora sp. WMMD792]MDG4772709.1 HEAT repeat domain-containing protein [Solwaraspora sp. WMMD792]